MSFLNVHWLALRQNISNFNITKKEYSIKIKASVDTRRGEDLEFTTDPNFFELIFNVLTLVTKIWALAMDHWSLVTKIWAWAMDHWPLVTKI